MLNKRKGYAFGIKLKGVEKKSEEENERERGKAKIIKERKWENEEGIEENEG